MLEKPNTSFTIREREFAGEFPAQRFLTIPLARF